MKRERTEVHMVKKTFWLKMWKYDKYRTLTHEHTHAEQWDKRESYLNVCFNVMDLNGNDTDLLVYID